jgi:hypothetical protein
MTAQPGGHISRGSIAAVLEARVGGDGLDQGLGEKKVMFGVTRGARNG